MTEYNALDPRTHVDAFVSAYAQTGNPLNAWFAYDAARRFGQPIPDLVLQYFDRVAARLWEMGAGPVLAIEEDRAYRQHSNPAVQQRRHCLPRPPKNPAPAVMKALEMGRTGRGSVFERHRTEAIAERLAWDVADLVLSEGQKPDHAINEVAEDFGVSRETARRAWKLHKTRALADMARVKAQAKALRQRWDDAGGADGAKARHETRMREWAEECIRTRPEWVADLVRRGLVSPPDPS